MIYNHRSDSTNEIWDIFGFTDKTRNPKSNVWLQNQVTANVHILKFFPLDSWSYCPQVAPASPATTRLYSNQSLELVQEIIDQSRAIFILVTASLNYSNFLWIKPMYKNLTLITLYNYGIKLRSKISGHWKPK